VIQNIDSLKELAASSAGLKALCTFITANGIEDLRKCCGGNGYLLNSGISQIINDYYVQVTAEGDFVILGLFTAKHLIKSIAKIMSGSKLSGIMEYFNVIGEECFNLSNIMPKKVTNASEYFNLSYLLNLFKFRSLHKNYSVAMEMNKLIQNDNFHAEKAFLSLSTELLSASQAHCYYIIMHNYVNFLTSITCPKIKNMLSRLCCLFALSHFIEGNWGEIIDKDQYWVIKTCINDLLNEIRPDAVPIVDSFDFQDYVLRSTIGRYDGNVYESLYDSAQKSILNRSDPFDGYSYLKPYLNKDLVKKGNIPLNNNSKF